MIFKDLPFSDLREGLRSLELATGLVATVHDMRGIIFEQIRGRTDYYRHREKYCDFGRRKNSAWDANCLRECISGIHAEAARRGGPFLHSCWKGASEIVVPAFRGETLFFILYLGVFRRSGDKAPKPGAALEPKRRRLPLLSDEKIKALSDVLALFAQGLLNCALDTEKSAAASNRAAAIRMYLLEKAHADASLKELAERLCLSVSRTRHIVEESCGKSFKELLFEERMSRGARLLRAGEMPQKEVAAAIGIPDVYYFNRCFKKRFGTPPGEFRKRERGARAAGKS